MTARRAASPYHLIVRGEALAGGGRGLPQRRHHRLPARRAHRLHIGDPAKATPLPASRACCATSTIDGDGPQTDILCGEFHFDTDGGAGLLAALPPCWWCTPAARRAKPAPSDAHAAGGSRNAARRLGRPSCASWRRRCSRC
jgi:hypothetical protein